VHTQVPHAEVHSGTTRAQLAHLLRECSDVAQSYLDNQTSDVPLVARPTTGQYTENERRLKAQRAIKQHTAYL
jgi:hypothetical protein